MSLYTIFRGVTAQQTGPLSYPNQVVGPEAGANPNLPAAAHAFTLTVSGAVGSAATVQCVGSNDGVNFVNYGPAFTATIGATGAVAVAGQSGIIPYDIIGGYITAISGASASATLTLSA